MVDWIVGIGTLLLLWQQNRIFKQQNRIFDKAEGTNVVLSERVGRITVLQRYWPMLAMAAMMILTWVAEGYNVYDRHSNGQPLTGLSIVLGVGITCAIAATVWLLVAYLGNDPSHTTAQSLSENAELKAQVDELKKNQRPDPAHSKLNIHYAFYGIGNSNDIDLKDTLQKLVPMDAIAVTINNNLIVGHPDPAPNRLKTLRIAYSYGGQQNIQFSRPEHTLLVLPRDIELIQETATEYERKRIVDVGTLETKLQEKDREAIADREEIGRHRRELNRLEDEKAKLNERLNSTIPLVTPIKFGALDRPGGSVVIPSSNGLTLSNDGKGVAFDISIPAFTIGEWTINFAPMVRLGVDEKTPSFLWTWHDHQGSDDLMGPLIHIQQVEGTLGNPVPFKIIFRNADNEWFASLCELRFNPNSRDNPLEFRFIRREIFVP